MNYKVERGPRSLLIEGEMVRPWKVYKMEKSANFEVPTPLRSNGKDLVFKSEEAAKAHVVALIALSI